MTTEPTLETELIWDRDNVWEYVIYLPLLTTEMFEIIWMTTKPTLENELIWDRDNVWEYVIYCPILTTENVENNLDDHRANFRDWIDLG